MNYFWIDVFILIHSINNLSLFLRYYRITHLLDISHKWSKLKKKVQFQNIKPFLMLVK